MKLYEQKTNSKSELKCIEEVFKKVRDYNKFGAGEGIRTLDLLIIFKVNIKIVYNLQ